VHLRRLKAEAEQRRRRNLAAIQTIFDNASSSFSHAAQNPKQIFIFIGYLTLLAVAMYTAREATRLLRILIESAIGKPKLIRETTRRSLHYTFISLVADKMLLSSLWDAIRGGYKEKKTCKDYFDDLVLPEELKHRVVILAKSASQARRHNAPHRHILLYGPPGTGKTMVARKFSECVGMDYALMSGGDVGPLGSDAVTQIHTLFSWAKVSPRGVLLFIDEAEAFLASRSKNLLTGENAHNALNALLYNTGGERRDFMLVLATNRADDLDPAVLDRCDESLQFSLPNDECRSSLLMQYFNSYVRDSAEQHNQQEQSIYSRTKSFFTRKEPFLFEINSDVMDCTHLRTVVKETAGFSGREIGKMMVALQSALHSSEDGKINKRDVNNILNIKTKEHAEKMKMVCSHTILEPGFTNSSELHSVSDRLRR